jgi:Zn-dependent protease with chaperone function
MDFYSSQDVALKRTRWLIVLLVLAVLSIVVLTNFLVLGVTWFTNTHHLVTGLSWQQIDWVLFCQIGLGVILFVGLGSLYRIHSLSGGVSIAELMGATRLIDARGDLNKKRVLNVVDEMAIASGTPVPPIYILDEQGINAFAAGYQPRDAIIGITQGAIEKLSRDQLQGVIAHEFSHILNGDMRLNIRLMGILYGITLIGEAGSILLRGKSRKSSRGTSMTLMLGVGLMIIGYAGIFFGNLIKAAVSRQREFLADASAVQFTRNPEGIAGALKRIGGDVKGSLLTNPKSSQISHSLFSEGMHSWLQSIFATHPPLSVRIGRILKYWDGKFDYSVNLGSPVEGALDDSPATSSFAGAVETTGTGVAEAAGISAAGAVGSIMQGTMQGADALTAQPSSEHVDHARRILEGIPDSLLDEIRDPFAARAAVYCLVLDKDVDSRNHQLEELKDKADQAVYEVMLKLYPLVSELPLDHRLPLLELSLPALHQLSHNQYLQFIRNLDILVEADRRVSLFEWMVRNLVGYSLERVVEGKKGSPEGTYSLKQCSSEVSTLLSLIAHSDRKVKGKAESAFAEGKKKLPDLSLVMVQREQLNMTNINLSFRKLSRLQPLRKPLLLKACVNVILADQQVSSRESELLRVIGVALDCPIPPLVQPQQT